MGRKVGSDPDVVDCEDVLSLELPLELVSDLSTIGVFFCRRNGPAAGAFPGQNRRLRRLLGLEARAVVGPCFVVWGAWALWPWLSPAAGHWALWPCAACSSAGWATGAQPAADVLHSFLLACRLLLTRALGPWFLLAAGFWALWPRCALGAVALCWLQTCCWLLLAAAGESAHQGFGALAPPCRFWALWPCGPLLPALLLLTGHCGPACPACTDWVLWPCLLSLGSGALDPLLTELGTGAQALFAPLAGPSLVTT